MINSSLDFLFRPQSVAIAGVSDNEASPNLGALYVRALLDFGFEGKIYPIHPGGGQIFGLKIYRTIEEVPGIIDYVIFAIPAKYTPQLLTAAADKGVQAVHFFTSGFGEIEDSTGKQLEARVIEIARKTGIRIIGPNCMGIYCPTGGLTFAREIPKQPKFVRQPGHFSFISQSGGNSIYCIRKATAAGIYFSKVVSYGNAIDLNEIDFLRYLANDDDTKIIGAYIEGVRDGGEFFRVLKNTAKAKPVIIFKVGSTDAGSRAASSHTGAIAGSRSIWPYLLRQAGAIPTNSLDEIVEIVSLFENIHVPKGRNALVFGSGGGATVKAADDCIEAGLMLPEPPIEARKELRQIFGTEAGAIYKNPLDLLPSLGAKEMAETIKLISGSGDIHVLIAQIAFDTWSIMNRQLALSVFTEAVIRLKNSGDKPVVAVLHYIGTNEADEFAREQCDRLIKSGIPVFPSISHAARAISKFIHYHEFAEKRLNAG